MRGPAVGGAEHVLVIGPKPESTWRGCCVTIGNFDGVHVGHRELIARLVAMTRRLKASVSLVLTFDPHPAVVLSSAKPLRLMPVRDRAKALFAYGVDAVWVVPFTREYSAMSAHKFVEKTLVEELRVRGVVVGPDSRFGAGRAGDVSLLESLGRTYGFEVEVIAPVLVDKERVSSSLVRALVAAGDVARAARFLGRRYRIKGKVVGGAGYGTRLGFPTANLSPEKDVMFPATGVYIVEARLGEAPESARPYQGVANVGTHPTLGEGEPRIEAHLFGVSQPLYGNIVTIEFIDRIRDEKRFERVEELKAAIQHDIAVAKEYFNGVNRLQRTSGSSRLRSL